MTLKSFLAAAFTLLVEEKQRLGGNLMDALDAVRDDLKRASTFNADEVTEAPVSTARQNDASLQEFNALVQGLSFS